MTVHIAFIHMHVHTQVFSPGSDYEISLVLLHPKSEVEFLCFCTVEGFSCCLSQCHSYCKRVKVESISFTKELYM